MGGGLKRGGGMTAAQANTPCVSICRMVAIADLTKSRSTASSKMEAMMM